VAIANALHREAARAMLVLSLVDYDAICQVWSRCMNLLIYCRIIALLLLIHYVTLWPWPLTLWLLTFDLKHLQCVACDVMKLCTKFERAI